MIFRHSIKGHPATISLIASSFAAHLNRPNSLKEDKVTFLVGESSLQYVWGMYFDKTSRDEQIPGSRVLQTGISCRSLVAGE